ncbi:MAG: hypothetical protein NC240_01125 [Clostridium sp.]|nr:hypothetical protein [Clostridium sp.]
MENGISFQKLTPTDDVDLSIYENAFQYIFENDDIKNVAISGPYSAGKSSVLETYKKKYTDKKFIHISLAHFRKNHNVNLSDDMLEAKKESEAQKDIETILEGKILNQLIQQIDVANIPQTNFHVKREVSNKYNILFTALSVVFILSLIGVVYFQNIVGWIGLLPQSVFSSVLKFMFGPYLRLVFLGVSVVILSVIIYSIIKIQRNKGIFRKFSVQGNEIEIFSDENDSYFDKYLNEVLYLFEKADADVIVFEDIDRYEIGTIFERLREINQLVNIRLRKKNEVIRFFYLLKDDIFVNKDRTKFFDFIMPVIPVIDSSNAYNKFKGYLEEGHLYHLFDEGFLRDLSLYIDDLRILKNIYNEFCIYYKKLNKIDLNPNKMLAVITYKNIFPSDFAELQLNRGYVYTLFNKTKEFIVEEQEKIEDVINDYLQRISLCEKEHLKDEKELDTVYEPQFSHLRNYYSKDDELKKLQKEKADRKQAIEDRDNNEKGKLEREIQSLKIEKEKLIHKSLKDIITRENAEKVFHTTSSDELGKNIEFLDVKGNEYFALLKYLLWNGYIDETYNDYISIFYENSLTINDKLFLRSITDRKTKGYEYKIDDVKLVLQNLNVTAFAQEETRNFALFQEILKNTDMELFLQGFMLQMQSCNCFEFLYEYLNRGQEIDIFLIELCRRWNNFFECMLREDVLSQNQIHDFSVQLVSILEFNDLDIINIAGCLTEYISGNKNFLDIKNPEVDSIIENIDKLGVKFLSIDESVSNAELLERVYKGNLYVLDLENIHLFISRYYHININDENIGSILSIIEKQKTQSLCKYVRNNISDVIAQLLEQEYPITDDEDISIYILNLQEIDIELRKKYIEKLQGKISILSQIEEMVLREKLIEQSKAKYSLDNIVTYYSDISAINTILVSFINGSEILDGNITESTPLDKFWLACLRCNEIFDEKYREIMQTIKYRCDTFSEENLKNSKVEILIEEKIIPMNEDNLIFMRDNYPEVVSMFIKENLSAYVKLVDEKKVAPDEADEMLDWHISDSDKILLLQNATGTKVSVRGKKISDEVFAYIMEHNYDSNDLQYVLGNYQEYNDKGKNIIVKLACANATTVISMIDEIDLRLLDDIMQSNNIGKDMKLEILLSAMKRLSSEKCKEYLILLSYSEFAKVFELKRRPNIAVTPENKQILESMRLAGFIKSYEENIDTDIYRIRKMEANDIAEK